MADLGFRASTAVVLEHLTNVVDKVQNLLNNLFIPGSKCVKYMREVERSEVEEESNSEFWHCAVF